MRGFSYWQFSSDEVSALERGSKPVGESLTMSGYEASPSDTSPINSILSFTEMQYGADDVLGTCQLFDGGADNLCYCNQGAVPVGPPWNPAPIGTDITTIGAFHGRSVLTSGPDAVVDVQDSKYTYAAHQTIGKGHVFVYTDEWVTYSSQWLTVGGDGGSGIQYGNPYDPCYERSSGKCSGAAVLVQRHQLRRFHGRLRLYDHANVRAAANQRKGPLGGRRLSAHPFAIPASRVLAYGKYAPRDSPPASLGLGRNAPTS